MKRYIVFCAFMMIAAITLSGCAGSQTRGSGPGAGRDVNFAIKPSGQFERCFDLKPGVVMEYSFETSDFVNFNVHYHAGDKLKLPVHKKGVLMDEGKVDPSEHDYYSGAEPAYCLMWINSNEEVVKGSYRVTLWPAGD